MATKKPQAPYLTDTNSTLDFDAGQAWIDSQMAATQAKEPEQAGFLRTAGDVGIKAAQGAVDLGQSVVGAASLATGGLAGKAMRAIGYDPDATNAALGEYLSPSQQAADAKVQQADGFTDSIIASIENPRAILGGIAESAPGMLAGMGATSALAARIGLKAALATTEGRLAAGLAKDAGKSAAEAAAAALKTTAGKAEAEAAIKAAETGLLATGSGIEGAQSAGQIADQAQAKGRNYSDYALPAATAGALTAGIGLGAGRLFGDAATDLAAGSHTLKGSRLAKMGKEAFSEGVAEEAPQSAQEQYFTNVAEGEPDRMKGVGNAAGSGMVVGGVQGGGMAAFHGKHQPAAAPAAAAAAQNPAAVPVAAAPVAPPPLPANAGPLQRAQHAAATSAYAQAQITAQSNPLPYERTPVPAPAAPAAAPLSLAPQDENSIDFQGSSDMRGAHKREPIAPLQEGGEAAPQYDNGIDFDGRLRPADDPNEVANALAAEAARENQDQHQQGALADIENERAEQEAAAQSAREAADRQRAEQAQAEIAERHRKQAERAAQLEPTRARRDEQLQEAARQHRAKVLDEVLADMPAAATPQQKLSAFSARLRQDGVLNLFATPEEVERVTQHGSLARSLDAAGQEYAAPNELVNAVPERKPAAPTATGKPAAAPTLPPELLPLARRARDVTEFFKGLNKIKNARGEHVYPQNARKDLTAAFKALKKSGNIAAPAAATEDTAHAVPPTAEAGEGHAAGAQDAQSGAADAAGQSGAVGAVPAVDAAAEPAALNQTPHERLGHQANQQRLDRAMDAVRDFVHTHPDDAEALRRDIGQVSAHVVGGASDPSRNQHDRKDLDIVFGEGYDEQNRRDPDFGRAISRLQQHINTYSHARGHGDMQAMLDTVVASRPNVDVTAMVRDALAEPGHADKDTGPAENDLAGHQIDKEWTAFSPESGTLAIPRADMPQIKAEHRGALVNFLKARGITHEQEHDVEPNTLKPTQREFSPAKVQQAKEHEGGDRAILVSSDNYILDGHHQWLAKLDQGEPVRVIRFDAPIRELMEAAKEFPSAEVAEGATPASQSPAAPASTHAETSAPAAPAKLSIGKLPNSAEPITVRDGVVHIGDYPAQNFDSGDDVTVPQGATPQQIKDALIKAGAIAKGNKIFGMPKEAAPAKPEQSHPAPSADNETPATTEGAAVRDDRGMPDEDPLDAELQAALGHFADVAADVFGAKLNATGQKHTAGDLLPALSKIVELLVRKGFRSFSAAIGNASKMMRANPQAAAYVDQISARQWKAAYNAVAEYHDGTDSEESVAAMPADQVLKLAAPAADVNTPAKPQEAASPAVQNGTPEPAGETMAKEEPAEREEAPATAAEPELTKHQLNKLSIKDMTDAQLLRAQKELPKRAEPVAKEMKRRGLKATEQAGEVPSWFAEGSKADPFEASDDAEYMLEDDEVEDWDWRVARVPVTSIIAQDEAPEPERIEERLSAIRDAETVSRPIYELQSDGRVTIIDGWHRLQVAKSNGQTHIEALVGRPPVAAERPETAPEPQPAPAAEVPAPTQAAAPIKRSARDLPDPPTFDYRLKVRGQQTYLIPPVGKAFTPEIRTALRDWLRDAGYFSNITSDNMVSVSETSTSPELDAVVDGVQEQKIGRQVERERASGAASAPAAEVPAPTQAASPATGTAPQIVKTADGKEFKSTEAKLVGSVKSVRDRDIHKPAVVGEFPVFVEQSGSYRLFTYNKKITEISAAPGPAAPATSPVHLEGSPEYAALDARATTNDKMVDALTDDQVRTMYAAMNLAGSKQSVDKLRETIKAEHPDDVEAGLAAVLPQDAADAAAPAQHIEDGQAEQATPTVITASLKKSADHTVMNNEEARADLLQKINAAILAVGADTTTNAADTELHAAGQALLKARGEFANARTAPDTAAAKAKVAAAEQRAVAARKAAGFIVFDVPGDGKFTVANNKDNLTQFRDRVMATEGFKGRTRPQKSSSRLGTAPETAIHDMLEQGEQVAAHALAKEIGKPFRFTVNEKDGTPNLYTDVRDVTDMPHGVTGYIGRLYGAKKAPWLFIEHKSGLAIGSGATSAAAALNVARSKLDTVSQDAIANGIQKMAAKAPDQAALEATWLARAEQSDEAFAQAAAAASDKLAKERDAKATADQAKSEALSKISDPGDYIREVAGASVVNMGESGVDRVLNMPGADVPTLAALILAKRPALAPAVNRNLQKLNFVRTLDGNIVKWQGKPGAAPTAQQAGAPTAPHATEPAATPLRSTIGQLAKVLLHDIQDKDALATRDDADRLRKRGMAIVEEIRGSSLPRNIGDMLVRDIDHIWDQRAVNHRKPSVSEAGRAKALRDTLQRIIDTAERAAAPAAEAEPVIPEGYKPLREKYYRDFGRGTVLTQGYAPHDLGDRVKNKTTGHTGVIDGFIGSGPLIHVAMVKYDNGTTQSAPMASLVAEGEKAAPAAPKIGDAATIMGVDAIVADSREVDGVRYELYNASKMSDKRGFVRVVDVDSGERLDLRRYDDYDAAEKGFEGDVEAATRAAAPAATPSTKEPWQMRYQEYLESLPEDEREWEGIHTGTHRASVLQAIKDGKMSADAASADYPEIGMNARKAQLAARKDQIDADQDATVSDEDIDNSSNRAIMETAPILKKLFGGQKLKYDEIGKLYWTFGEVLSNYDINTPFGPSYNRTHVVDAFEANRKIIRAAIKKAYGPVLGKYVPPTGGLEDEDDDLEQGAPASEPKARTVTPDSLNVLRNPVEHGDTVRLADGSEWQARQGYTGMGWSLVKDKQTHPLATNMDGQANFIGGIIKADEAAKERVRRDTQAAMGGDGRILGMRPEQLGAKQGGGMADDGKWYDPELKAERDAAEVEDRRKLVEQQRAENAARVEQAVMDPRIQALKDGGIHDSQLLQAARELEEGDDSLVKDLARIKGITLPEALGTGSTAAGTTDDTQDAPRLKNFGWDAVKLSDAYTLDQLAQLRHQVEAEHANPLDAQGHPLENGQSTIYLYDKKGRAKLDKLSWAVTYKMKEARDADAATPAAEAAKSPTEVLGPVNLAEHARTMQAIEDGELPLAAYKANYQRTLDSEAEIKAELNAKKKDDLLKLGGYSFAVRYKNDNKDRIVSSLYNDMLMEYVLNTGGMFTYGMDGPRPAIAKKVAAATAEDLQAHAQAVREARAEHAAEREARTAGMADPQTLDDFTAVLRAKMAEGVSFKDARLSLTPEQRAKYDDLVATKSRAERADRKVEKQEQHMRAPGEPLTATETIKTRHTKHGHDLWQFQLDQRLPDDEYQDLLGKARALGGTYSTYRGNGAVPGWQFRTPEAAAAFKALIAGDASAAKEVLAARRDAFADDKSQSAAERLNEMADQLDQRADDSKGAKRKTNTARRARFAAAADAAVRNSRALAATMRNIAAAMTSGTVKFLDRVRTKTQLELIRSTLSVAQYAALKAKYNDNFDFQKHKDDPITAVAADYAEWPSYTAFRSDLAALGRQLLETEGTKKLGQAIMKVANDVTSAYLTFAKENFHQVATFSNSKTGERAAFTNEKDAENAIARSGYKGKAIAYKVKAREYAIIMSPSEAMEHGVWKGDGDKRITLHPEVGAEIVEKLGKLNRRNRNRANPPPSAPWQFDTAHDQLAKWARMGIESPAEMRAALREYIGLREAPKEADKVKELERAMVGRRNDGLDFFPTPEGQAEEMVAVADVQAGMRVLEPSAGMGHIADIIRAAGVEPDVVEMGGDRRELLEAKGYNLVGHDFMDLKETPRGYTFGDLMEAPDGTRGILRGLGGMGSDRVRLVDQNDPQRVLGYYNFSELQGVELLGHGSGYDRIIMNPPFSDRRDAQHVQHAYSLLKPGGRLVAIMGEGVFFGKDKRAQEFRDWLDAHGGTSEKLDEGTFMDPSLPVNTGVNARMVVVDKPAAGEQAGDDALMGNLRATDTKAFQDWFGDSKVTNPDGTPKVLYHGTLNPIDGAMRPGDQPHSAGIFFTDSPEIAGDVYAGGARGYDLEPVRQKLDAMGFGTTSPDDAVTEAAQKWAYQVQRQNRYFDWTPEEDGWSYTKQIVSMLDNAIVDGNEDMAHAVADALGVSIKAPLEGGNVVPVYLRMRDPLEVDGTGLSFDDGEQEHWIEQAKAEGKDGVVIRNYSDGGFGPIDNYRSAGRHTVYIAFDPAQVKSATGNSGAFDPANPDLTGKVRDTAAASDFDQSLHAAIQNGATAIDLLRTIAAESSDPEHRALAEQLLANGVNPTVGTGTADGETFATGIPADRHAASYDPKADHVALYEPQGAERNLLHELTHAATAKALRAGGRAAMQMKALYADAKRSGKLAGMYGMANVDEFVAEAHSNPAFQQALRGIEAGPRNLWERFVDLVRAIVGVSPKQRDMLGRVLEAGRGLMAENGGDVDAGLMGNIRTDLGTALANAATDAKDINVWAGYKVGDFLDRTGKVGWWHKTIGTMKNLALKHPAFRPVYEAVQNFLADVSRYATMAGDLAPRLMPQLEDFKDIFGASRKQAVSAEDTRAIATPIFDGTKEWARDDTGRPVKVADLVAAAAKMTTIRKEMVLVGQGVLDKETRDAWRALPPDAQAAAIDARYTETQLQPGVVWSDAELRSMFNLNDGQIALYREFRAAVDKSLTNLTISEMTRMAGKPDPTLVAQAVAKPDLQSAAALLRNHYVTLAQMHPDMADMHLATAKQIMNLADKGQRLIDRGYAPLQRFGQYTVYMEEEGEPPYFGMYETSADAAQAARSMKEKFPAAFIRQGTMSQEEYKLFAGVSPESMELFGSMLGLGGDSDAADKAYQKYIQLTKANHSAMKRMMHRKGTAGYSEDVGRVLANFLYSNARLTSSNFHTGEIDEGVNEIPKEQGQLKDEAVALRQHVRDPQSGGTFLSGLMFAQFLGGSVASAAVNFTQPIMTSLPYLSQWGGLAKAGSRLVAAVRDARKDSTGDAGLDAALEKYKDVVAPQEVHYMQAQAAGKATLRAGDGTKAGDARAKASNVMSAVRVAWGKLFAMAEQSNRRITFIAAYRTAMEQGNLGDAGKFAAQVVKDTQFVANAGNKMAWGRNPVGGLLLTFKGYSIQYLEMLGKMAFAGAPGSPERKAGQRALLYAMAVMLLMAGSRGLPFEQDIEAVIDGLLQRMGYNFSSKRAMQAFLAEHLGEGGAAFATNGMSGLPGMPFDAAGRLGSGHLIPGIGALRKKASYTSDVAEIAGPAADLVKRGFTAAGKAVGGDLVGAALDLSPAAVRNLKQGVDMAHTGTYRDARGYIINQTTPVEAGLKALGFQPNSTANVQDAKGQALDMIAQSRMRSNEIAEHWAQGRANHDEAMVAEARAMRADWNEKNPEAKVQVSMPGIIHRARAMREDALARTQKTAGKALKAAVRRELSEVRD